MPDHTKYIPVSCHFHDELELLALRGTLSTIVFRDEQGEQKSLKTRIKTWNSTASGEFLVLESGPDIRLDHIIQVNDLFMSDYCGI